MRAAVQAGNEVAKTIRCGMVSHAITEGDKTACRFEDGGSILVSKFLAAHLGPGDEISFPLATGADGAGTEIYIRKTSPSAANRDVYQAPIGYAARPKSDKRGQLYVRAAVSQGDLGISALHFPCTLLRDYFYVADRRLPWEKQKTLYDILRISSSASPAELRLAFRLRELELRAEDASRAALSAAERAFNILACPELRACYEELLSNPTVPVLFPYGGFGSIIVLGERSELEAAAVVETPHLGHATYLFSKPRSMEQFLAAYIRTTKEDIRHNRGNVAEVLGFLGRVIHGASPRTWLAELKAKVGEHVDYVAAADLSENVSVK